MSSDGDSLSKISFIHGLMKKEVDELRKILKLEKYHLSETGTPPLDAMIRKDEVIITAELPGLNINNFTVYIYENLLIIEGVRKIYCTDEKLFFIRAEREFTPFRRVMQLPFPVENDNTHAVLNNGVLTVTLKKAKK